MKSPMRKKAGVFILLAAATGLGATPAALADHVGRVRLCTDPSFPYWLPSGPEASTGTCVAACPYGIADDFPVHCRLPPPLPPTASIHGVKFNDLDGDAIKDAGEVGIPGWQIELDCGSGIDVAITDEDGEFSFVEIEAPISCTVAEVQQQGWAPTTSDAVGVDLNPGDTVQIYFGNITLDGLIQNLIQQVEGLVADDVLKDGNGIALIQKLEAARNSLDAEHLRGACGSLGAFVNQVEALLASGHLAATQGASLIDAANAVIDGIPCESE